MKYETGLTLDQFRHLERICSAEMIQPQPGAGRQKELSSRNLLLLTLKWLRRYPTSQDLALQFGVARTSIGPDVARVLDILDPKLAYLRSWPIPLHRKIHTGPLKGTIGAVDTFPICIPQPESLEDRKRFYIYKPGHQTRYGWKVQTFVDLQGRILDVTSAHPFGSKSDITLFRESQLPGKLNKNTRAVAPPINLASRIERRMRSDEAESDEAESDLKARKLRRVQYREDEEDEEREELESQRIEGDDSKEKDGEENSEEDEEPQGHSINNIGMTLSKALGDKAYQGAEGCYVPYKRFKRKNLHWRKKKFNKILSSYRVIVENVNKRLEDWKVIGTIFRSKERNPETISKIVRVVASLCNWTIERHPLRKGKRKA